jgi:hypothetical protein
MFVFMNDVYKSCIAAFENADKDGNGVLDFDEFEKAFRRNFQGASEVGNGLGVGEDDDYEDKYYSKREESKTQASRIETVGRNQFQRLPPANGDNGQRDDHITYDLDLSVSQYSPSGWMGNTANGRGRASEKDGQGQDRRRDRKESKENRRDQAASSQGSNRDQLSGTGGPGRRARKSLSPGRRGEDCVASLLEGLMKLRQYLRSRLCHLSLLRYKSLCQSLSLVCDFVSLCLHGMTRLLLFIFSAWSVFAKLFPTAATLHTDETLKSTITRSQV